MKIHNFEIELNIICKCRFTWKPDGRFGSDHALL